MLDEKLVEHHHAQLKFHRILYGLLAVIIFILYCCEPGVFHGLYIWLLSGTVVLGVAETVCSRFAFWNRVFWLRALTYMQYTFYLVMMYLEYSDNLDLTLALGSLMLTFMFEFSYYNDICDSLMGVTSILLLTLPAIACVIIYFCVNGIQVDGFLLLLAYVMFCVFDILIVRLFYLNESQLREQIHALLAETSAMEEKNEELVNYKNRMQKVNEELNLQRVQLGQMNREIQQSNSELEIQTEVLKFINNSFSMGIPRIITYIIDVILRVRKVEFAAIYIDRDICYNKRPYSEFKCVSNPALKEVPELERLFRQAGETEEDRRVFNHFSKEEFPGISQTGISSLLILPLVMDGRKYGIIVSGSKRAHVFDSYIRFYDIIVPQLDLAIHNIRMYAQMQHIAQTDGLTGINNRIHFNKLFAEQMERTIKEEKPITVALFDIDKFKRINDTYGHLVGDEVIKEIAHLAAKAIEEPELGFICRYGGEEFVLALPDMTIEQALPIIQKLHEEIASTEVTAYGYVVTMNVSIGVSAYPELCQDMNQLIKRADKSMYYAKEHGRGQIKVDGPDVEQA